MNALKCPSRVSALAFFCSLCFLTACAIPHYDVSTIPRDDAGTPPVVRLHDVAFPLLVAAADWCVVDHEPTYGFLMMEVEPPNSQMEVEGESRVSVAYVHPQSPAASAGLMPGDRVVRVNERAVVGMGSGEVSQLIRRMTVARIQPMKLDVLRNHRSLTCNLRAVPSCQFSIQLIESNLISGVADGKHIGVTTGMIRFIGSEDELAWVVAHEIAHNVLNHSQNARLRAMLHSFLNASKSPGEASTTVPQRSLEARADYIGAYIMARAGYNLRAIKEFWTKVQRYQSGQSSSRMNITHPTTAERLAAFEVTLKEIQEKQRRGEALLPLPEGPSMQIDR